MITGLSVRNTRRMPVSTRSPERREARAAVVGDRHADRAEDPVRHGARPGDLQEVTAGLAHGRAPGGACAW